MTTRNFLVPYTRAALAPMLALACLAPLRATDFVLTTDPDNLGTTYFWIDTNSWNPVGYPNGPTDNVTVNIQNTVGGSPNIEISLLGSNVTLNTLSFNESLIQAFQPQANFTNGNLFLNSIVWTAGAAQEVDFEANLNIFNRTSPLVISNKGWTLDFLGGVTSTNGFVIAGDRLTRIHPTNLHVIGDITLNLERRVQGLNDGVASGFRLDTTFVPEQIGFTNVHNWNIENLRVIGDGSLQPNAKDVTGDGINVNVTNLIFEAGGKGVFHYHGHDGLRTPFFAQNTIINHTNAVIRVTASQVRLGQGGGILTQTVAGPLTFDSGDYSRGAVIIDAGLTNRRTGTMTTYLNDSIVVQINNQTGIGTNIVVGARAQLNLATNMTILPTVYLTNGGGSLSGALFAADYAGAGQNVFLSDGATISTNIPGVAGVMPTFGEVTTQLGSGRLYYGMPQTAMGVNNFDFTIDATNSQWKGIAFGEFTDRLPTFGNTFGNSVEFRGDIFAATNNPIEIKLFPIRRNNANDITAGGAVVFRPATDANGPASLNATNGIANIRGAGSFILQSQDATNAIDTTFSSTNFIINRYAERDVLNFNDVEFRVRVSTNINPFNALSLPTNFVMNLYNARARLENTNAQASIGGVVNVNTNALWFTDNTGPTRGQININNLGTLHLRGTSLETNIITGGGSVTTTTVFAENIIANGGSQHIFLQTNAVGAKLLLDVNSGTTMDLTGPQVAHIVTNTDLILSDSSSIRYKGIVLGDNHRLTTALGDNFNLSTAGGAFPLTHNATNGKVIISTATLEDGERRQLSFNVPVELEGTDVEFGSLGLYETVMGGDDTRRILAPQTGNILINGAFTGGVVTVVAGTLQVGDGGGPGSEKFVATSVLVKSNATLAGSINPFVSANGNIVADVTVERGGILSPGSAGLRSNEVSRLGAMLIGDSGDDIQKNLTLNPGSFLDIQINEVVPFPGQLLDVENDLINVYGTMTITGAILRITMAPDATPFFSTNIGDAYIFGAYSTLIGEFGSVLVDPNIYGYIDYNYGGNNLLALVVPEPTTWVLMLAGLGIIGMALRRRGAGSDE